MTETARRSVFGWCAERMLSETDVERRQLLESLAQTRVLIRQAYTAFNNTGDPDLIDSYVFEINALQSRYSYLLRRIKQLDGPQGCVSEVELSAALEKTAR